MFRLLLILCALLVLPGFGKAETPPEIQFMIDLDEVSDSTLRGKWFGLYSNSRYGQYLVPVKFKRGKPVTDGLDNTTIPTELIPLRLPYGIKKEDYSGYIFKGKSIREGALLKTSPRLRTH